MKSLRDISILLILLSCGACQILGQNKDASDAIIIKSGYFFGECFGLCKGEMVVQESSRDFTLSTWNTNDPVQVYQGGLEPNEWISLQNAVDLDAFCAMDDVYGCPDCADGGGEYITLECDGIEKTVTFDFGSNELSEINALLALIRPLRLELEPDGRF